MPRALSDWDATQAGGQVLERDDPVRRSLSSSRQSGTRHQPRPKSTPSPPIPPCAPEGHIPGYRPLLRSSCRPTFQVQWWFVYTSSYVSPSGFATIRVAASRPSLLPDLPCLLRPISQDHWWKMDTHGLHMGPSSAISSKKLAPRAVLYRSPTLNSGESGGRQVVRIFFTSSRGSAEVYKVAEPHLLALPWHTI